MEIKNKCKYCKHSIVNYEYLLSEELYPPKEIDFLLCGKKSDLPKVDDDFCCDSFKLDNKVYRESNP